MNVSIDYGDFSTLLSTNCYRISREWLKKLNDTSTQSEDGEDIDLRPPTIFGEPHVIKYLRLMQVKVGEVS